CMRRLKRHARRRFVPIHQFENFSAALSVLIKRTIERRQTAMMCILRAASEGRWPRICNE
ncbi:MAG: hypothetical protein ACREBW_03760, partial [Candidatus Micrarchaeaceae archaeon]